MLILGRKDPCALYFKAHLLLGGLFRRFSFESLDHAMEESVVFIDVPANCVQHKFLVHLLCKTVIEPAEFFVILYVPKVPFCLYGTDLAVQDSFFTLNICMGFFLQPFLAFVDFHDLVFICIFSRMILVQAFCLVRASAAVCTPVHFKCLCISVLFFCLCPDMP